MSQDYNQTGLFNFSNDFETSQQHQQHVAQQIRREKLCVQHGFDPSPTLGEDESSSIPTGYEATGMLSEMFGFHTPPQQHHPDAAAVAPGEWYGNTNRHHGADQSAAAMHLFLRNPTPHSPNSHQAENTPPSTLNMLIPHQPFHQIASATPQFSWVPDNINNLCHQGLSLSLSSSLQHLEVAKQEEYRMGDGGNMLFFNQIDGNNSNPNNPTASYAGTFRGSPGVIGGNHIGFGPVVNVLRSSKYVKAAQELLEEFCSVGRAHLKKSRLGKQNPYAGDGTTSTTTKDFPPMSATDRIEHQRRKVKLLSMLDEVDRRYNHYCEQMQMVVNSFDLVMGFGSAIPYTALARKAMSRHFRCLKDTITAQLKTSCELLGDKEAGTSGVTKGETPRLKLLEQSFRQQRAFHQMGMMEQEAWRPQRGLPERSVNILRAWLFEHFLHPYPSDADKHLLARQTGLSRNQVSNWFINARVRLWKPMVEEMYQQESKDEDDEEQDDSRGQNNLASTSKNQNENQNHGGLNPAKTQNPMPSLPITGTTSSQPVLNTTRSQRSPHPNNLQENDPSIATFNTHLSNIPTTFTATTTQSEYDQDTCQAYGPSELIRFGNTGGDVSLTLGLHHTGNFKLN